MNTAKSLLNLHTTYKNDPVTETMSKVCLNYLYLHRRFTRAISYTCVYYSYHQTRRWTNFQSKNRYVIEKYDLLVI